MLEGLVFDLDTGPPRLVTSSIFVIIPVPTRSCVRSTTRLDKAAGKVMVSNAHGVSPVNVILVPPRHHNRISAILPPRNSGRGRSVDPGFGALIPAIASHC